MFHRFLLLTVVALIRPIHAVPNTVTGDMDYRVVWVEDGQLMGLSNSALVSALIGGDAGAVRPLLSSDGGTVYFSRLHPTEDAMGTSYQPEMFALPVTGGIPRPLGSGVAIAVWRDGANADYVYALSTLQTTRRPSLTGDRLVRFQPAQPDEREIVWTTTPLAVDSFQLSRDGRRAAGLFPYPQAGLADMEQQTFLGLAHGTWPSLAPDDSYVAWVLDGSRRRLRFFVPLVDPSWTLAVSENTSLGGAEISAPRWSNDPQVICFTAATGTNATHQVHIARLRDDLRKIESISPISQNSRSALWPDVWIAEGFQRKTVLAQHPSETSTTSLRPWPVSKDALVVAWVNLQAVTPALTLHGWSRPGLHNTVQLSGGTAHFPDHDAAALAAACRASNAISIELLMTEKRSMAPLSVRLLTLKTADGKDAWALYRVDQKLVLRVLTGTSTPATERITLTDMAIDQDRPFSLALTLKSGRLTSYIDGQKMKTWTLASSDLGAWTDGTLVCGDATPYGNPWSGTIERIALFSRLLGDDEIKDSWVATSEMIQARKVPPRIRIKAKLLEMPTVRVDAGGHMRRLHASAWEVEQVNVGALEAKTIQLLQWAWLDGQVAPLPKIAVGQSMELEIESLEDYPELTSEIVDNNVSLADLPVYYDPTTPGRHPAPFPPP